MGQRSQECFAPNVKALRPNIAGIMNNREAADDFVLLVKRQSVDVQRGTAHSLKRACSMVLTQCLRHYGGNGSQRGCQLRRNCQQIALAAIDSQSREMLPVPEVLYNALQILHRVFLQVAFHISREAFAQYLGAPLQIPA
jgi:hypothetical protein